ncbi:MAG: C_GCAxxG_C_C family protein [Ignavibacteriae bacterium]|nr:C_GCAxxG_C_C family protein [Ignavibacteriota bacterium]
MNNSKQKLSSIRTIHTFLTSDKACSGTLCYVINKAFGYQLKDEERAAMPFAGGIMQHGYQCGMIWGAALAAGAQSYRLFASGTQAETNAIIASQRLVESFRASNNHIDCFELTDINKSSSTMKMITYFLLKGGTIECCRMASRYAPIAFTEINNALSNGQNDFPQTPVSCSAMLAQKMGLSEMHTVMVAGFAGGIGLSGGACGALGAAIWIIGLNSFKEGADKINFKNPKALDTIDRFLKCTGYEFECSKIVRRKFNNVSEHASYLCGGGCSEIIEALANN